MSSLKSNTLKQKLSQWHIGFPMQPDPGQLKQRNSLGKGWRVTLNHRLIFFWTILRKRTDTWGLLKEVGEGMGEPFLFWASLSQHSQELIRHMLLVTSEVKARHQHSSLRITLSYTFSIMIFIRKHLHVAHKLRFHKTQTSKSTLCVGWTRSRSLSASSCTAGLSQLLSG